MLSPNVKILLIYFQLNNRAPVHLQRNKLSRPTSSKGEEGEESRRKLVVKNGVAIDPDSDLSEKSHVYQENNDIYTATLTKTNVSVNQNSNYRLQLLESDDKTKYWLFKGYGRTGTDRGSYKETEQPDLETAKMQFKVSSILNDLQQSTSPLTLDFDRKNL